MAAKPEQNRQQVDKDESISNNDCQSTILAREESFQTPESGAVMVMGQPPNIHNPRLLLTERISQKRHSEETEQGLFKAGIFCTRCVDNSSESIEKTWFNVYQEELMKHKISCAQFKLIYLNNNGTRLVDGLLTTTLCSTEL